MALDGKNRDFRNFLFFLFLKLGFWAQEGSQNDPEVRGVILTKFQPKRSHLDPIQSQFHCFGVLHFWRRLPMSAWGGEKMMDCSSDNDRMLWHRMMDCSSDNDLMLWCHLKQKRSGAITNAKKLRRLRQIMPAYLDMHFFLCSKFVFPMFKVVFPVLKNVCFPLFKVVFPVLKRRFSCGWRSFFLCLKGVFTVF